MRLYEYEAKKIFQKYNIPVPRGILIRKSEITNLQSKILFPLVLKAQVLSGERGKSGGIKFAANKKEYLKKAGEIFNLKIKGLAVKRILAEEKLKIEHEIYLGITINRSRAKIVIMVSRAGGVEIEEMAKKKPSSVIRKEIDILEGLNPQEMSGMLKDFQKKEEISGILLKLYKIFLEFDCEVCEINPLVITDDKRIVAVDARIGIDDEALFRHKDFKREDDTRTPLEKEAGKYDLGYIELAGNIGVIGNGAGLNLATLDILQFYGGKPANFAEVSGRTYGKADKALEIILKNQKVKAVFGNFFGCISRCDVIAGGLAKAIKNGVLTVPMVVAMRGLGAEEGCRILKEAGIEVYEDDEIAGKRVVEVVRCQS